MRTTTQLNQVKLKSIRENKGWSQQKLANEAFGYGHSKSTDEANLCRMYQRIEKTGRTSPERARKIADALGYELLDLQSVTSIEQYESAKFIASRIRQRIRYLKLSENGAALERIGKIFCCTHYDLIGWDNPNEEWHILDEASRLVIRIPELEFLGKTRELNEIYNALYLQSSHFQPAALRDSFWFVYSELNDSMPGNGSLFFGLRAVEILIDNLCERIKDWFRSAHVTTYISKQGFQDRLEIQVNSKERHLVFETKPCAVDRNTGISWKEPTIWEVDVVRNHLIDIGMNQSDVVVIDGVMNPPESSLLFCRITQFKNLNPINFDPNWDNKTKLERSLSHQKSNWKKYRSYTFFERYGIARYLNKVLSGKVKDEFEFKKIDAGLELRITRKISDHYFYEDDQLEKFVIHLGWNNPEGEFKKAPWPEWKRDQFIELRRTRNELDRSTLLMQNLDFESDAVPDSFEE